VESIISRLLNQFEQGHLSRRKLVQSLALAATGAHALRSAKPAAAAESASAAALPRTAWIDHVSYGVADYGRSRDFYADLLGWEVTGDDPERGEARLRIGEDLGDIIIRNSRSPAAQGPTGVVNHICWGLDTYDTDGVRDELERRGLNPRRDQGGRYDPFDSYHVLDPDGWDLQLAVRLRD
jgi:hypothetical protein